jgi:hypothetical protein
MRTNLAKAAQRALDVYLSDAMDLRTAKKMKYEPDLISNLARLTSMSYGSLLESIDWALEGQEPPDRDGALP